MIGGGLRQGHVSVWCEPVARMLKRPSSNICQYSFYVVRGENRDKLRT